jgi:hypothetical protein
VALPRIQLIGQFYVTIAMTLRRKGRVFAIVQREGDSTKASLQQIAIDPPVAVYTVPTSDQIRLCSNSTNHQVQTNFCKSAVGD